MFLLMMENDMQETRRCLTCQVDVTVDYRETRTIMGKEYLLGYCTKCNELTDVVEVETHEHAHTA